MLRYAFLVLFFCASSIGQSVPADKAKPAPRQIPTFEVKFEPDPNLSVPFAESGYPAIFSEGCSANGSPYVRVDRIIPPHSTQILNFDPKGIVTFETGKISDIVEPKWIADFVSDSELYILVEGDTHTEQHTKRLEDGKNGVYWDTKGEPRYYIAQFDLDGTYKSTLRLDLPFRPTRLSGFPSGNFLVIGSDEKNVPHVGLLDSSGQLLRYIEFPKEKQEPAEKTIARSFGLTESPDLAAMTLSNFASLFQYQDKILYARGRSGAPMYEIGAGGEAHAIKIKAIAGYSIDYFLPSDRNWFVVLTEEGKFTNARNVIYEVDPSSGEFLGRYLAEGSGRTKSVAEGQSDIACVHAGEFISVRDQDGKADSAARHTVRGKEECRSRASRTLRNTQPS